MLLVLETSTGDDWLDKSGSENALGQRERGGEERKGKEKRSEESKYHKNASALQRGRTGALWDACPDWIGLRHVRIG
jgi:hypothetical protein